MGDCSSPGNACDIQTALSLSNSGDEVVVGQGTYSINSTINVPGGVFVHGTGSLPYPLLTAPASMATYVVSAGTGAHLRYLRIDDTGDGGVALSSGSGTFENLFIENEVGSSDPNQYGAAASLGSGAVLRDSVVWAPAGAPRALGVISIDPIDLRNDTIWTPGSGSIAVRVVTFCGITCTGGPITLKGVIARGGPGGYDLDAVSAGGGGAVINVSNSNYRASAAHADAGSAINDQGANQTGVDPVLADPTNGDFHELFGSPTIDQGVVDAQSGTLDYEGNPRTIGSAPDIGAFELPAQAPSATTGAASAVTMTSATLGGSVNPRLASTTDRFEWGLTTAYGNRTGDQNAGGGANAVPASATISGLAPGTTYHYRLLASNSVGSAQGADQTFTTLPDPFAGMVLGSKTAQVKNGVAFVRETCPAGTPGSCDGTVTLTSAGKVLVRVVAARKHTRKVVKLGSAHFTIPAGQTKKVAVKLSKLGRKLVAKKPFKAIATVVAHDGLGISKTTAARVTLKPAKAKRRRH